MRMSAQGTCADPNVQIYAIDERHICPGASTCNTLPHHAHPYHAQTLLNLWAVSSGQCYSTLFGHTQGINAIAFRCGNYGVEPFPAEGLSSGTTGNHSIQSMGTTSLGSLTMLCAICSTRLVAYILSHVLYAVLYAVLPLVDPFE